jgi:hypothetical protein
VEHFVITPYNFTEKTYKLLRCTVGAMQGLQEAGGRYDEQFTNWQNTRLPATYHSRLLIVCFFRTWLVIHNVVGPRVD